MGKSIWNQTEVKKRDDCFQALDLIPVSFNMIPDPAGHVSGNGTLLQWQADQAYSLTKVLLGIKATTLIGVSSGGFFAFGWSKVQGDLILQGVPFPYIGPQGSVFASLMTGSDSQAGYVGPQNMVVDFASYNIYLPKGQILYLNYSTINTANNFYLSTTLLLSPTYI